MDRNFLRLKKGPFWIFCRGTSRARRSAPAAGLRPGVAARESAFRPLTMPTVLARRAG